MLDNLPVREFGYGVLASSAVAGVALVGAGPRRSQVWARWWAVLAGLTVAALGFDLWTETARTVLVAAVLLSIHVAVTGTGPRWMFARFTIVCAGSAVLVLAVPGEAPSWSLGLIGIGTVCLYLTTGILSARSPSPFLPVLWLLAACGVLLAVPDTEAPAGLIGVLVPIAALTLVLRPPATRNACAVLAGLYLYSATLGAIGRPASLVAAAFCTSLLVLGAVLVLIRPRHPIGAGEASVLVLIHGAGALVIARWAGITSSISVAVERSLLALAAVGVASLLVVATGSLIRAHRNKRPKRPRRPSDATSAAR